MNADKDLEQQLNRLGAKLAAQPSIVEDVMRRVETAALPRRRFIRLWSTTMKAIVGLAASLVIGTVAWFAFVDGTSTPAYGIDGIEQRLMQVQSIHTKGWRYFETRMPDGARKEWKFPCENYIGRPTQRYMTGYGDTSGVMMMAYQAEDAERYINVDIGHRKCTIGRNYPFATEWFVEAELGYAPRMFRLDPDHDYQKVRSEKVGNVTADVYEAVQPIWRNERMRSVLWLNPRTGWPVRLAWYTQEDGQPEKIQGEFDTVEVNVEPPPGLFDFEPPAGYEVVRMDRGPESVGNGSSGSAGHSLHRTRFHLNINDQAVLLCWAWYDNSKKPYVEPMLDEAAPADVTLTLEGLLSDRKYRLHMLRVDPGPGFHWRWSLVVPEDGQPIGEDAPQMVYRSGRNRTTATINGQPGPGWKHARPTLAKFVLKAQQLTLPPERAAEALTLEQIEAKIREIQGGKP